MSEQLTDAELKEMRVRCGKAENGPWKVVRSEAYKNNYGSICGETEVKYFVTNDELEKDGDYIFETHGKGLAILVAASRTDLPRCLDEIASQAAELAELRAENEKLLAIVRVHTHREKGCICRECVDDEFAAANAVSELREELATFKQSTLSAELLAEVRAALENALKLPGNVRTALHIPD